MKAMASVTRDELAEGLGGLGVLLGVADQRAGQRRGPFPDRHRLPGQHHAAHRAADLGDRLAVAHGQRHLQVAELGHDLGDLTGAAMHPVGHGPISLHRHEVAGQRLTQGLGQHASVDRHVRAVDAQRGRDQVQRERVILLSHQSAPQVEMDVILVRLAWFRPDRPWPDLAGSQAVTDRQHLDCPTTGDLFRTLESAMPATEHLPGTLGPYRLQDRLGEGGVGVVHRARDREGRPVAVKVLHPLGTDGVNARRRLAREVETMRRVRSPYVAEVLDADVTGEYPYIVTRFVAGPTLDEMVRTRGPLSGPGLRRLAHGMAEALTAIHAAGVVHRDLKPGNVMLTDDRPIVIDFGIAQAGDATRLTQTGLVMGTPGYLAPEVIEGQPSSPASDVHSWGATMAYAATGRAPYGGGGDSFQTIFYRIVSGHADLSGVPGPLVPLLSAALARDPSHRPSADWLSAQASSLDLAAAGPAATALGPRPTAVITSHGNGRPAIETPDKRGQRAKNQRPQAYPAPKQAARDVADLLPPVGYAPFPPPGPPPPPRRTEARKAPQPPRTRTPGPPRSPAAPPWPAWPS